MEQIIENTDPIESINPQNNLELNDYKLIHVYNGNTVYHLTRQILLDTYLSQKAFTMFFDIFCSDEFNNKYSSFACLIDDNRYEANLYLNVNDDALRFIINFIQTGKCLMQMIGTDKHIVNEIIDLATMFGMPQLISEMKKYVMSSEDEKTYGNIILSFETIVKQQLINYFDRINMPKLQYESFMNAFDSFFKKNNLFFCQKMFRSSHIVSDEGIFFNDLLNLTIQLCMMCFPEDKLKTNTPINKLSKNCSNKSNNFNKVLEELEQVSCEKRDTREKYFKVLNEIENYGKSLPIPIRPLPKIPESSPKTKNYFKIYDKVVDEIKELKVAVETANNMNIFDSVIDEINFCNNQIQYKLNKKKFDKVVDELNKRNALDDILKKLGLFQCDDDLFNNFKVKQRCKINLDDDCVNDCCGDDCCEDDCYEDDSRHYFGDVISDDSNGTNSTISSDSTIPLIKNN